jgi:hypothetical protein
MNPTFSFVLSILTGISAVIAILRWFEIKPGDVFKREWWDSMQVMITKRRLLMLVLLVLISLALSSYGFYIVYRLVPVPKIVQWGVSAKHCNVIVDTTPVVGSSGDYDIAMACGIIDPTIDQTEDTRIILSGPFIIHGGLQAISAASNPDFDKYVESFGNNQVSFWQRMFLIPKDRNTTEIHKLSDIDRIKGKLF